VNGCDSAIEDVIVPDGDRAQRITNRQATTPRNRSEQELAGYRDAQDYLFRGTGARSTLA